MSHTQVQLARGTTTQVLGYTGPVSEAVVNTDDWSFRLQDNITAGGIVVGGAQRNSQTGTSYTIVQSDQGKIVSLNNASAVAVTLPQAGSSTGTVFPAQIGCLLVNIGAGLVTIMPTTSTINGQSSITLSHGQGVRIISDGTNYLAILGGLGLITGALRGNGTGGVSQAAAADLSDTVAPTSWTPTDQSGAALTFTSASGIYYKIGKIVVATVDVTYPASPSSAAQAVISLPATVSNLVSNNAFNGTVQQAGVYWGALANSATVALWSSLSLVAASNNSLAGLRLRFGVTFLIS